MYTQKMIFMFLFPMITVLSCGRQEADIVLKNGDVYTVEEDRTWARAVVISGNKITAVLENEKEADKYIGPNTRIVDLAGKLADITVIDRNIIENDPEDLLNMKILMTIVDGNVVFEK